LSFDFIGRSESYGYVHGLCSWPQKQIINPFGFKKKTAPLGPPGANKNRPDQSVGRWRRVECFYWMTGDGKRNTFTLLDGDFTHLGSYLPIPPDQEVRFHIAGYELIIDNVQIKRSTDEDARWLAKNFADVFLGLRAEKEKKTED
jgi:hypothetical protein